MNKSIQLAIMVLLENKIILSDGKGSYLFASREVGAKKSRELTPVQAVIRAYKLAKGIDKNNTDWDKANFARYSRAAKSLIQAFNGDDKAAVT